MMFLTVRLVHYVIEMTCATAEEYTKSDVSD